MSFYWRISLATNKALPLLSSKLPLFDSKSTHASYGLVSLSLLEAAVDRIVPTMAALGRGCVKTL